MLSPTSGSRKLSPLPLLPHPAAIRVPTHKLLLLRRRRTLLAAATGSEGRICGEYRWQRHAVVAVVAIVVSTTGAIAIGFFFDVRCRIATAVFAIVVVVFVAVVLLRRRRCGGGG